MLRLTFRGKAHAFQVNLAPARDDQYTMTGLGSSERRPSVGDRLKSGRLFQPTVVTCERFPEISEVGMNPVEAVARFGGVLIAYFEADPDLVARLDEPDPWADIVTEPLF